MKILNQMVSFFIGTIVSIAVFVIVGNLVSKAINDTQTLKQDKKLEKDFKQLLANNEYESFNPDMEIAAGIIGLQIQKQRYIPNIKPIFYFKLDKSTKKADIHSFLTSLPNDFLVNVPALTISFADSKAKSIFFWKNSNHFQLTYKQDNNLILLSMIQIEDLTEKIFGASAVFNFQTVTVERAIFS